MVLNKCDLISHREMERLCTRYQAIGVSAKHVETLAPVMERMARLLDKENASGGCEFSLDHFEDSKQGRIPVCCYHVKRVHTFI